jgi:AraC-like DNA-binding protein
MIYQTFDPSPNLNTLIKCYWTLDAPQEIDSEKQRIVPDGCMEMIFHYGDAYLQYAEDGNYIVQPKSFVFGQITKTLEIAPTGTTGVFAARFHPDGFMPITTVSINTMENRAVPLIEVFGEEGLQIEQDILTSSSTQERIKIIEVFLLNKLTSQESVDRIIKSSIAMMLNLKGKNSIADLAKEININRRQLERRFSSVIGLSPKQLAKIIRLQAMIKALLNSQPQNLTSIAYEGDYYDQAHFIKDFKEFTGISPKKFYAGHLKMSSLFAGST